MRLTSTRSLTLALSLTLAALFGACSSSTEGTAATGTAGATGSGGSMPAGCPADPPGFTSADACSEEGKSCDYGEECCCGSCYASYVCTCSGGAWSCHYTDACFGPCQGTGGGGGGGGDAGADGG